MPRVAAQSNSRAALRVHGIGKAGLVPAADAVIDKAERALLSERDSLPVLALLAYPPAPNGRLIAAALKAAGKLP